MKDELQLKLVEILTSIQTAAGKASDFALEQLPDIAQSYVLYGRVVNTVMFFFLLCVCVGICIFTVKIYRGYNPKSGDAPKGIVLFMGGCILLLPLIASIEYFFTTVLVWAAPKVWLLKEIAGLLK